MDLPKVFSFSDIAAIAAGIADANAIPADNAARPKANAAAINPIAYPIDISLETTSSALITEKALNANVDNDTIPVDIICDKNVFFLFAPFFTKYIHVPADPIINKNGKTTNEVIIYNPPIDQIRLVIILIYTKKRNIRSTNGIAKYR